MPRLKRAITGHTSDERRHNGQKSTKPREPIKCECKDCADGRNYRRRSHPLTPFRVHEDQASCLRHPLDNFISLVAPCVDCKLRCAGGQDQYRRSELGQCTPASDYCESGENRPQKDKHNWEMHDGRMKWLWNLKHAVRAFRVFHCSMEASRTCDTHCVLARILFSSIEIEVSSLSLRKVRGLSSVGRAPQWH